MNKTTAGGIVKYEPAPEVEEVAKSVIAEHFDELKELQEQELLRIAYLWRPEAQSIGEGRVVAGCCVHVDDRNWSIHGNDFLIVVARDVWDNASSVNPEAHRALVHHELLHVGVRYDEDGGTKVDEASSRLKTYCRNHDVEEFEAVLSTYGAWHGELRRFLAAYKTKEEER
jgi:hypothetical protein